MYKPGKKYVVLPPETYEMLLKKQQEQQQQLQNNDSDSTIENNMFNHRNENTLLQPVEKNALIDSEREIRSVWDRDDLSDEQKVKYFTSEMNKFLSYRKALTKTKPLEVKFTRSNNKLNEESSMTIVPSSTTTTTTTDTAAPANVSVGEKVENKRSSEKHTSSSNFSDMEDDDEIVILNDRQGRDDKYNDSLILAYLPKATRNYGKKILDYAKLFPTQLEWTNNGEVVYRGVTLKGSSIKTLLRNVLSKRPAAATASPHDTFYTSTFVKALADINVPSEWIRNEKQLELYRAYSLTRRNNEKNDDEHKNNSFNAIGKIKTSTPKVKRTTRTQQSKVKGKWLSSTTSFKNHTSK